MADPIIGLMYVAAGAASVAAINKDNQGIGIAIGALTVLSFFQWSGTYFVVSAIEAGIGAAIAHMVTKED